MTTLEQFKSYKEEDDLLESHINRLFDGKAELQILEAGCGQHWPLKLNKIKYRLTGADLDKDALEYRINVSKDLDEAIVGDLRTLDLGTRQFEVIYSAYVLEHVENAAQVLENFSRWLKPGGIVILKLPDRDSVFGFLTKSTPFWFHVVYHKYVLGRKNSGKPGYGPYPTHYDRVISRDGIREFCKSHCLTIREMRGMGTYVIERGMRQSLIRMVAIAFSVLSFGSLPWRHNNLTYVLEKN